MPGEEVFDIKYSKGISRLDSPTQIGHFNHGKKAILHREIGLGSLGAMVFDVRIAAGPQDLVVVSVDIPVEGRETKMVVQKRRVLHEKRCPRRIVARSDVAANHF